jgi:hypothetical protein
VAPQPAGAAAPAQAPAAQAPYQPNWPKLAALVDALRNEIVISGGFISAELTWPTEEMGKYYATRRPDQKTPLAESQNGV